MKISTGGGVDKRRGRSSYRKLDTSPGFLLKAECQTYFSKNWHAIQAKPLSLADWSWYWSIYALWVSFSSFSRRMFSEIKCSFTSLCFMNLKAERDAEGFGESMQRIETTPLCKRWNGNGYFWAHICETVSNSDSEKCASKRMRATKSTKPHDNPQAPCSQECFSSLWSLCCSSLMTFFDSFAGALMVLVWNTWAPSPASFPLLKPTRVPFSLSPNGLVAPASIGVLLRLGDDRGSSGLFFCILL